ncbi:MAG: polysaccharide deacetylase family protein [Solirubrobacteraceae bacterium]
MKDGKARDNRRAPSRPPLSAGELSARRAALRRGRTQRRRTALAAVLSVIVIVILIAALASSGGKGTGRHAAPSRVAAAGARTVVRSAPRNGVAQVGNQALSVDRVLGYTSYVQLAGHRRPDVALTFDDGPSAYTGAILRILRQTHTPATFFVIGRLALAYPRLVAAEARAGCEVGDHTETHYPLALLPPSGQAAEITQAAQAIQRAGAPYPVLLRPPYGSFDPLTLQVLRAQRMLMVLWSADTSDYERPGVSKIIYTAVSGGQPGAIILMHDGGGDRSETVAALPRIIVRLRQRGFRLVTVSQLLADDPPPSDQPAPTPLSGAF